MDGIYIIGTDEFNFIKVNGFFNYDTCKYYIYEIMYQSPLDCSTFFNYEEANKYLKEIREYYKQIKFTNFNLIQNILDKVDFNKKEYVDNLKVFELYAKEVKEMIE